MWKRALASMVSALVVTAAFGQQINADQKKAVLDGVNKVVTEIAFVPGVDFSKWSGFIEKRQEQIDAAETIPAFATEVNRALREFGFSHIRLQTPRQATARTQTSVVGIGVSVQKVDQGLKIAQVRPESPASEAGIKLGEIIVSVNGKPAESTDVLEGSEGEKRTLEIQNEQGERRTVEVQVKRVSTVRPETLTWKGEDLAVINIRTFSTGYSRENVAKLMSEASKAKYLVIDLRNNGGGSAASLGQLLGLLMPNRTEYGTFVNRTMVKQYQEANPDAEVTAVAVAKWSPNKLRTRNRDGKYFEGKIAVLINRGSGSASEICAAALREQRDAILVGAPSAGAVLASQFYKLPEGFSLQFPMSDYVTPKGMRLEGNPLKPDIEVRGVVKEDSDPVLEAAIKALKG